MTRAAATSTSLAPVEEDEYLRLSQNQSLFLASFVETRTIAAACEAAGIHYNTWYRWKTQDPVFQQALTRVSSMGIEQARANMDRMAVKASERLEEALDAKETTTCPTCKQHLVCNNCEMPVTLTNFNATLKAVEFLLKRQGDLMNRTHVTGDVKHTKEMTHEQRRGAAMWAVGAQIPPQMEAELKALGFISDEDRPTEAEVAEVEDIVEGEVVKPSPSKRRK